MTRRKLLLWGIPAVLGLAVVAAMVAFVLIPPSQASRKAHEIQLGMTLRQVRRAIGKETGIGGVCFEPDRGLYWEYDDGSLLKLIFADDRLTTLEVRSSTNPFWYDRLRARLRKAGLPI